MEEYHNKLLLLHKQAWNYYEVKRLEHREMHIELKQHQEHSRDVSSGCSAKAPGIHQYFGWNKLRAGRKEAPRRPASKSRFVVQGGRSESEPSISTRQVGGPRCQTLQQKSQA